MQIRVNNFTPSFNVKNKQNKEHQMSFGAGPVRDLERIDSKFAAEVAKLSLTEISRAINYWLKNENITDRPSTHALQKMISIILGKDINSNDVRNVMQSGFDLKSDSLYNANIFKTGSIITLQDRSALQTILTEKQFDLSGSIFDRWRLGFRLSNICSNITKDQRFTANPAGIDLTKATHDWLKIKNIFTILGETLK